MTESVVVRKHEMRRSRALDAMTVSFHAAAHLYRDLHAVCAAVRSEESLAIAYWRCWALIDIINRIREVAQSIPGLNQNQEEVREFLKSTAVAKDFRNYVQHLRREFDSPFPVWGSLSWADPLDENTAYTSVAGSMSRDVKVLSMASRNGAWVSRVSLATDKLSFDFDPVWISTERFRAFLMPWLVAACGPREPFPVGPLLTVTGRTSGDDAIRAVLSDIQRA